MSMTDTLYAIAREIEWDAQHWRKLAEQERREGNSAAAGAYELCADLIADHSRSLTALSNQGEGAVAWVNPKHLANLHAVPQMDRTIMTTPLSASQAADRTTPLYLHPAEADRRDAGPDQDKIYLKAPSPFPDYFGVAYALDAIAATTESQTVQRDVERASRLLKEIAWTPLSPQPRSKPDGR